MRKFEILSVRATAEVEHQSGLLPVSCPLISCSGFGTSSLVVQSTTFPFFFFLILALSSRLILLSKKGERWLDRGSFFGPINLQHLQPLLFMSGLPLTMAGWSAFSYWSDGSLVTVI